MLIGKYFNKNGKFDAVYSYTITVQVTQEINSETCVEHLT